jgi:hypothetical protein
MNRCTDACMGRRIDGWTDGWIKGWEDEQPFSYEKNMPVGNMCSTGKQDLPKSVQDFAWHPVFIEVALAHQNQVWELVNKGPLL